MARTNRKDSEKTPFVDPFENGYFSPKKRFNYALCNHMKHEDSSNKKRDVLPLNLNDLRHERR